MLSRNFQRCIISGKNVNKFLENGICCKERRINYSQESGDIPSQCRIVIAGAGIVANSVAYHLAKYGMKEVVVLEQNKIGSGTSDFSIGTIGLFRPLIMRNIILYSLELYKHLNDLGFDIDFRQPGCLYLAQTEDRIIALKRRMAYNIPNGQRCVYIAPEEVKQMHPYLRINDLEGAVWVPDDAVANPKAICSALSELAKKQGVQYFENCSVKEVYTKNGHVYSVRTEKGFINCEIFVNCTGMWARDLGLRCSPQVKIPAYPAEHFNVTTDQIFGENLPSIKDFDSHTYVIENKRKLTIGWFEKEAKPAFGNIRVPRDWKKYLQEDLKHIKPLWEKAVNRIPVLKDAQYTNVTNTVDNFTPDGRWILGEAPEVKNYFVACGMNGNALQSSGGLGKTIAEWIIDGRPIADLIPFNVARFIDLHNNRQYLHQRTKEIVGRHYSILYPHQCEYRYARKLRCSPLYSILDKRGAIFGIKMGYERALYFDTSKVGKLYRQMPRGSFFKPKFFKFMLNEYEACRYGVGIIDMSSFSKIAISSVGNEALEYLQNLCSNDVNVPIGSLVHTGMQNDKGGYENDCILVRTSINSYFMVSPTSQQTRVYDWMSKHLPEHKPVRIKDVTSMYTVINVVGPKSHLLVSELSGLDAKMSPMTYKLLDIGYASDIMVMSFTHTGEPGYCLYVPSEYALHVYERLISVGKEYGARDVGTMTQRFMRIERFIPFWGEELSTEVTPYESGNDYRVKMDKGDFIGRDALLLQKEKGITKKIVMFYLEDFDTSTEIWPWGGEPIYRNEEYVGSVTSTGYGFTTKKIVCLGFIRKPNNCSDRLVTERYVMDESAVYEVDIAGSRFRITPHVHPPYFPESKTFKKPSIGTPFFTFVPKASRRVRQ